MTHYSVLTLGLTAITVVVVMMLIFAVLRLSSAAKGARQRLRDTGSEAALLSVALQDAVSRMKAQEHAMSIRAIASEQLNGQIVESLAAGLLVVDREGRVETLNPAGHRMLGAPGDVVGRDYRAFLDDAPELQAVIAGCLETAAPVPRRRIPCKRGEVTQLAVTVSPLSAADGSSQGVICLFSDLTQMSELEEQLRLKEALARVGELTAGIAHEFRNGLATIHGYSRLIRPDGLPPAYRPYVDGIRQETEALGHVVTNFLKFARPEQVVCATVDLDAVIRRAVDELALELPQTTVEVQGRFGEIEGDEVLLRQVFGNLIRNAAEACEAAGVAPRVEIRGQADGRTCRISVDDNGPGVPEPARGKIFQPFFTTRSRGTGLGLAIVQKLVVTHNGRVSVADSPLGGASFQIVFPRRADDAETATVEAVEIG
ncbi:MAG TPA: ATP-binding protein [Vicinamibacterales bacterium]|jgi:PAS domain S-box-containing protein|nr:ATP-binding protein [Vicinamibacterales bacterium]